VTKERLDKLLVARELAETRQKAQAFIMAGYVLVNRERVDKPGKLVDTDAIIDIQHADAGYVGRGALKLEGALSAFNLDVNQMTCLDVGASTGGFTECLLQHGAIRVVALDVGKGQLHWKLRSDPRVVVVEGVNARYVTPADFDTLFDLITIDVSFISLTKILPALVALLTASGRILALVKPQFEVGKGEVGKGGIVRDPAKHQDVLTRIQIFAEQTLGLDVRGMMESPILGAEGNKEFFFLLAKHAEAPHHEVGPISHRL
jgi:23S rRNA (cytidine1920-2'-O)/16S rRNA (cytidine1409-2'-O)-methyltransferase